jgi:hypothetical protein
MFPIGPGGPQSGFSTPRYVSRDFRKKKSGPRTPRPPGSPPVLGSLVWSAEGLPSTRNWPFRLPVAPVTHQSAPGDTQGNVSRQLARAVVLGGRSCTRAHSHAARGALLQFEWLRKTRGAQAFRSSSGRPGRDGCAAELRPLFPGGGQEEEQATS